MLTGADTVNELKLIRDETIQLLKLGVFELSKWASNCPELLEIDNYDCVPEIMLRTYVFWACNGISARIRSNFSANLIQKPTLYQNGSFFPRSLNCFDPLGLPVIVIAKFERFVAIGQPMGRVHSSGHSHSLDCFQNTDE